MYDVIVLGTGPGGYYFTQLAAKNKNLKIAVIEKTFFGGVCLNVGCIPSKSLLNSAKVYEYAKHGENYGINLTNLSFDHQKAMLRKEEKVAQIVNGVKTILKKSKADIFEGEGKFHSKKNGLYNIEVNGEILQTKNVILATGSEAIIPPIPGLKDEYENNNVLTNVEILSLEENPTELVIIGAGVIGLEMAVYYATIGTKVTIIEMENKITGPTDLEISTKLQKQLNKNDNITFMLNCKVTKLQNKKVYFESTSGQEDFVNYEKVLVSIGRRPNVNNINYEKVGLHVTKQGVAVDEKMQTNLPNVYAIGDIKGYSMLAHVAYREAEVVVDVIEGKNTYMDYTAVPFVIYTNPEVSSVGLTQQQCEQRNIEYIVKKTSLMSSGRFLVENDNFDGLLKIIIEKETNIILGIHIIGAYSSEVIHIGCLIVNKHMNQNMIEKLILPHPTIGELIKNLLKTK